METQLLALEAILRDEVAIYSTLVNRLPFKLALIRKNRIEQLDRLTQQEEADLKRLSKLERERAACVAELIPQLGSGVSPRLSAFLPMVPGAWRERLAPLGEKLRHHIEALREGHETAKVLLKASLDYVDLTMNLVGQAVANAQPAMYGGAPSVQSPSLLLDWRA